MSIKTSIGEWVSLDTGLMENEHEFVVGDVHGRGLELGELLTSMENSLNGDLSKSNITFLGDLIDRGPCSIGAVQLATQACNKFGFKGSFMILGNHEVMMFGSMGLIRGNSAEDVKNIYEIWHKNGGDTVLSEIGLKVPGFFPVKDNQHVLESATISFGKDAINFLMSGGSHRIIGNLLFCHAGINPEHPSIEEWFSNKPWPVYDENENWLWIREPFYNHEKQFQNNLIVVHGHTYEMSIHKYKNRLNVGKDSNGVPFSINIVDYMKPDGFRIGLDGGSYGTGLILGAEFIKGAYRTYYAWNISMIERSFIKVEV